MGFKFLPTKDDWEKALATVKVKPDQTLSKALAEWFRVAADQLAKRLAMLPNINKLASDFKKSPAVVAAGPKAAKLVQDLIDVIPVVRSELEKLQKTAESKTVSAIDVAFVISDWRGMAFDSATGYVVLESSGLPTIRKNGKLKHRSLRFDGITKGPTGTVSLLVEPGLGFRPIEGRTAYKLRPGATVMTFFATQQSCIHKVKAKSLTEARKKLSIWSMRGLGFKLLKADGRVADEFSYKKEFLDEVEWEIEEGVSSFKFFKQEG